MSLDNAPRYSGGCQCGRVRFRVEGALGDASICHCRMCQKASGNFYQPLVSVGGARLAWTRGAPKKFQSSNFVFRGFCGDCGTPLSYEAPDGIALSIAAFDDPSVVAPTIQWGIEEKLRADSFLHDLVSYQHPDYDTDEWPFDQGKKE